MPAPTENKPAMTSKTRVLLFCLSSISPKYRKAATVRNTHTAIAKMNNTMIAAVFSV